MRAGRVWAASLLAAIAVSVAAADESGWRFDLVTSAAQTGAADESIDADDTLWVRPNGEEGDLPIWGRRDGLQVGLSPLPGPRGLLRVYAPYLGDRERHVINFIAIEPIPEGDQARGLSELEPSELDGVRGKRFWSVDDPADATPHDDSRPASGSITQINGVECLRVFVQVERFANGAHVYAQLTFREDLPYAVGIAIFAHEDSRSLTQCIATATMGNYARVRELHLDGRVVLASELWREYEGDGFTNHARFPLAELTRTADGAAIASVTPDETAPQDALHAAGTREHWRYRGLRARQNWRVADPHPAMEVLVNGRFTYWASQAPIPGGIAFKNFEMASPFRQGEEFWFSVEPLSEATSPTSKATR